MIYNIYLSVKAAEFLLSQQGTDKSLLFSDPPIVVLRLGSTLNADDIKEGDDVYFECHVRANPHWRKLTWLHNVSTLLSFLDKFFAESHQYFDLHNLINNENKIYNSIKEN